MAPNEYNRLLLAQKTIKGWSKLDKSGEIGQNSLT